MAWYNTQPRQREPRDEAMENEMFAGVSVIRHSPSIFGGNSMELDLIRLSTSPDESGVPGAPERHVLELPGCNDLFSLLGYRDTILVHDIEAVLLGPVTPTMKNARRPLADRYFTVVVWRSSDDTKVFYDLEVGRGLEML